MPLLIKISSSNGEDAFLTKRVMSPRHPSDVTQAQPFLLSLNATLVLMVFCFCFHKILPGQKPGCYSKPTKAKEAWPAFVWHKLAFDVWCSSWKGDKRLQENRIGQSQGLQGYLIKTRTSSRMEWLFPWHERVEKKKERRVARATILSPYGFSINQ